MSVLESISEGDKKLYRNDVCSGPYDQIIQIRRSNDDGSGIPKFYINVLGVVNGQLERQGYLYFYLDFENKKSYFIGTKVLDGYRNLNIGSFMVATWIDLCLNNGYEFLGVNQKQRKPFLLYLLKTYGFEVFDQSLYQTRKDVISIVKSNEPQDLTKYLHFKDSKHERVFS